MGTLLSLIIAGGIGGFIYTLITTPERKDKERKQEIAKQRAIERFNNLSKESKQLLNKQYTDEQILNLYIFEEMNKL